MSLEAHLTTPLAKAVRVLGSQSAFGRLIGRSQPTVWGWLSEDKPLPAEHVLTVEAATGISRHALRPDIYPLAGPASPRRHATGLAGPVAETPCHPSARLQARESQGGAATRDRPTGEPVS